ncbi:Hypothetical protein D9617_3g020530 [Elsinoe fawcettii]|nr:Hypothetical protein D9617_3g020530 [Elsinoe fawcettii]
MSLSGHIRLWSGSNELADDPKKNNTITTGDLPVDQASSFQPGMRKGESRKQEAPSSLVQNLEHKIYLHGPALSTAQKALRSVAGYCVRDPFEYRPARYVRLPSRVKARLVSIKKATTDAEVTTSSTTRNRSNTTELIAKFASSPKQELRRHRGSDGTCSAPSPLRPSIKALPGLPLCSADTTRVKDYVPSLLLTADDCDKPARNQGLARPSRPRLTADSDTQTRQLPTVDRDLEPVDMKSHNDRETCPPSPDVLALDHSSSQQNQANPAPQVLCTVRDLGSNGLSADSSSSGIRGRSSAKELSLRDPLFYKDRRHSEDRNRLSRQKAHVPQLDGTTTTRRPYRGGCEKSEKKKQWKVKRPGIIHLQRAVRGARKRLTIAHIRDGYNGVGTRNRCWRCAARRKVRKLRGEKPVTCAESGESCKSAVSE